MIKLNSKNITYVALADTNNSLKAPKEIWYADSSNSVKLVYRRKDALIEGEDYEKYHWVKGDGSAYIDTLVTSYGEIIKIAFKSTESTDCAIFGRETSKSDFTDKIVLLRYRNNNNGWSVSELYGTSTQNGYWLSANANLNDEEITIDLDNQVMTNKSGNSTQINVGVNVTGPSVILFGKRGSWGGTPNRIAPSDVAIKKFLVSNQINLIPCKLLKPVPKWLDANGIRRQVGECGMIDLVSGKFYGNVNSVGTFTVENYYERKEWLQGRNGAYIDTNYYPIVGTDVFSVHFHYDGTVKNPDGGEQNAFGVNYKDSNGSNFIRAYIQKSNKLACSYYKYTDTYPTTNIQSNEWNIDNLLINGSKFQYTANGTSYSFDNNDIQQQICQFPLFIFKNNEQVWRNNNYYLHGDISTFKITDTSSNTKMNLIPCTLTMDLPASMDANNTPRTKGTSGMWDLVSDRFYGNVANSGTFKAVNLAEGVDYKAHQWLIIPYTQNDANRLPINSNNINYRYLFYSFGNIGGLVTQRYTYYFDCGKASIWSSDNSAVMYRGSQQQVDTPILIDCSSSGLIMGGDSMPNYGLSPYFDYLRICCYTSDGRYALSSITVDGIERYIPVKLLKSIPSKYDANGIARQAGECGMYDTVNDLFYGNVASSGSFTVEDDN